MSIRSISAASLSTDAQTIQVVKHTPRPPSAPRQDSVHLSAAALAALGDADRDGDSK